MPEMPAIDQNAASGWSENDINLYNRLPYYFGQIQDSRLKTYPTWRKMVKKRRWTPKMGDTLKGVKKQPSPHLRQFANPNLLTSTPKKDVVNLAETTESAQLYLHRFETPALNFYPDFVDFLDHSEDHAKDLMEKIERYEDVFYRGRIFHMAPYVLVCEGNTVRRVDCVPWSGTGAFNEAVHGKTAALLKHNDNLPKSHLTLAALNHAAQIMEVDFRVPFHSGGINSQEDAPINGKYLLVTSSEAYHQFTFDQWLLQNKSIDLNIVNQGFRGSIFGMITSRLEDMPLRYDVNGAFAAPELRVGAEGDPINAGETLPNPQYTSLDADGGSPYEVAFLCGEPGYEAIEVGPPPGLFTGNSFPNAPGMNWNGKVYANKNFLVQTVNEATETLEWETNAYGRWIRYQAELILGILATQRRNVVPILFKRKRGE